VAVDDRVAVYQRVHGRELLERDARRLHEEWHERQLDAVFLLDAFLEPLSQRNDGRHVDLVERREVRGGLLRLEKILGDALAARRHFLARLTLSARAAIAWHHRARRGRPHDVDPRRLHRLRARRRRRRLFGAFDHVRLADDSATAGALNRRNVDASLGRRALSGRRHAHVLRARRLWRSGRRRWRGSCLLWRVRWRGGLWRRRRRLLLSSRPLGSGDGSGVLVYLGEKVVHLDHVAFRVRAFGQYAGHHGGDFDRALVRIELDQRFTDRDRIAFVLQPARYRRFGDRFTQRRNFDGGHAVDTGRWN